MSSPANVFIIRHGEKPGNPELEGPDDGPNLSARGHSRAQAIALQQLFPMEIDFIFATQPSKHSSRPLETITPYADSIKKKVNTKFADDEYKKLVKKLMSKDKYDGKNIAICWHHGEIPGLLKALGVVVTLVPIKSGKWSGKVFDRLIHVDFTEHEISGSSLPQKLLFGDSET